MQTDFDMQTEIFEQGADESMGTDPAESLVGKVAAQSAELRKLSSKMSRFMDVMSTNQNETVPRAKHGGDLPDDDLLSIFADNSVSICSSPSRADSYDPELDLLETPGVVESNVVSSFFPPDCDLYKGTLDFRSPVSDSLAARMTKAVTLPPKKESIEKIATQYLTPENAPAVCTPRIPQELWGSIPPNYRAADSRAQKLQTHIVKGLLPYAEILSELQSAASEKRDVDTNSIKRLALDGITLSGFASYEVSMRRREELKPSFNPKYKGICSRSVSVSEGLFGSEFQATLKGVGDSFLVSQKISPQNFRGRAKRNYQRPAPYRQDKRDYSRFSRDRNSGPSGFKEFRAPATVSKAPQSKYNADRGKFNKPGFPKN